MPSSSSWRSSKAIWAAWKAISWIIPNQTGLGSLDDYIVSIADLEDLIGASNVGITASSAVKNMLPATTWKLPSNCNLS
ncbi:hypothetical protein NB713_000352 [Xanthomonas sacchari]|nr:hypothetical protein [Xanthomonas sacchari]